MESIATLGIRLTEDTGNAETVRKVKASATSIVEHEKKQYAEKLRTVRASYAAEVEAAQKAMRERMRASSNSSEVRAVQEMYRKRVEAAQQAARAEVQLAQQSHLAATNGLRPLVDQTNHLTTAARRGMPTLNSFRSAMTSMAASAIGAVPGMTQLTGHLGTLAVGSAMMIGVMAGVAALAFAFQKLSEKARETRKATKEAVDELSRLAASQQFGAGGDVALNVGRALGERERLRLQMQGGAMPGDENAAATLARKERARLAIAELNRVIEAGQKELDRIRREDIRQQQDDIAKGAALGKAEADRLRAENDRKIAEAKRRREELKRIQEQEEEDLRNWIQRTMKLREFEVIQRGARTIPNAPSGQGPGPVDSSGQDRRMHPVPTGGGMDAMRQLIDPVQMATGMLSGIIGNFVNGLLDFSGRAAEAERAMREARQGFIQSITDILRALKAGDDPMYAAIERINEMWMEFNKVFGSGGNVSPLHAFGGDMDSAIKAMEVYLSILNEDRQKNYEAIMALEGIIAAARIEQEKYNEALREQARLLVQDLAVRNLVAQGRNVEAEDLQRRHAQEREIAAAEKAGYDAATIAAIRYTHALEDAAVAAQRAAEEIKGMADLHARGAAAQGNNELAEDVRRKAAQDAEMDDARKAGRSPEFLALLAFVHNAENNAIEQQRHNDRQARAIEGQLDVAREALRVAEDQLREQERAVEMTKRVMESLKEFRDGLMVGDQSILSPRGKLDAARSQYEALLFKANGGDKDAAMQLAGAGRTLLDASRGFNASGQGYVADFNMVIRTIEAIQNKFGTQLTIEEKMLVELQNQSNQLHAQIAALEAQLAELRNLNKTVGEAVFPGKPTRPPYIPPGETENPPGAEVPRKPDLDPEVFASVMSDVTARITARLDAIEAAVNNNTRQTDPKQVRVA